MGAESVEAKKPEAYRLKVVNVYGTPGGIQQQFGNTYGGKQKWIKLGQNNTFPEYCMAVIANCGPLSISAQRMSQFLTGLRYEPLGKDGKIVEAAAVEYASWFGQVIDGKKSASEKEFRARVMADLGHLSALSVDIATSKGRSIGDGKSKIVKALFHRDVTRLRVGPKDDKGNRALHFWSANWEKVNNAKYKPLELPVFDAEKPAAVSNIYRGHYTPGQEDYFLPRWIGALADAETWASVPIHNKTQADAGFSVRTLVFIPGNKDSVDLDQIDADIEKTFIGPNGKPYMVLLKGNTGDKPDIVPLERGDKPGESEGLRDKATEHIITTYGVPKILLGMDAKTGMDGAGAAVEEIWNHFLSTSVIPMQDLYTDLMDELLRLNGFGDVVKGRIVNDAPWKFTDNQLKRDTYMRTTTVNNELKSQGKPELPVDDKRGSMFLAEIGPSYNIPQVLAALDPKPPANG